MRRLKEHFRRIRAFLPEGGSLPDDAWLRRHKAILVLLYAHVAAIFVFGLVRRYPIVHCLIDASPVAILTTLAAFPRFRRSLRSALASLSLITCSAVLVHLSGGAIEMHFHFFVALGVLTLYQDWHPFLMALGYVVVHHGLLGVIAPQSVYDHPSAWRNPWVWAGIHGFFVISASIALIISWRLNEIERARSEGYRVKLGEASLRRQQALEINDNIVQGLTVAQLALELGRPEESLLAVEDTLAKARTIISSLLGEMQDEDALNAGDLVRARPALIEVRP
jgi:hypothetical protein